MEEAENKLEKYDVDSWIVRSKIKRRRKDRQENVSYMSRLLAKRVRSHRGLSDLGNAPVRSDFLKST